ncbi:MAG: HNH endonuclease, partial [Vulcanimicrobiaceae bacterium]
YWIDRQEQWDASDNLIATTDVNGNETDYQYDDNGNVITVAEPAIATSVGTFRPTSRYAYDQFNNVVRACDAVWDNPNGNYGGSNNCTATATGVTALTWSYPTYEPFGELDSEAGPPTAAAPSGYTKTYAYATSSQGGSGLDYGLPTSVVGTSFPESNGNTVAPTQTFIYDAFGNLKCYSKYSDPSPHYWALSYTTDGMNRVAAVADPDDQTGLPGVCANTPGLPGSHLVTTTTYNPDGTKLATQTPAEYAYASGVSTTNTYDADGNQLTTGVVGNVMTTNFYDGADRLVEVDQPNSNVDTRYLYDVSASVEPGSALISSGAQSFYGTALHAWGNQWGRERYMTIGINGTPQWYVTSAESFDGLDRETGDLRYQCTNRGTNCAVETATKTYDQTINGVSYFGLQTGSANAVGQSRTMIYDADQHLAAIRFSDTTPSRTYTYDPDGRQAVVTSSLFGPQTYQYDAGGNLTKEVEASGDGLSFASTLSTSYYPNNERSQLNVVQTATGTALFNEQFAYRADDALVSETLNYDGTHTITKSYTPAGRKTGDGNEFFPTNERISYNPAGEVTSIVDPYSPGGTWYGNYDFLGEVRQVSDSQAATNRVLSLSYDLEGQMINTSGNAAQKATEGQVEVPYWMQNGTRVEAGSAMDFINGVPIGMPVPIANTYVPAGQPTPRPVNATGIDYDAAGRQGAQVTGPMAAPTPVSGTGCTAESVSTSSRYHDAEDHVSGNNVSTVATTWIPSVMKQPGRCNASTSAQSNSIAWGPAGHPVLTAGSGSGQSTYGGKVSETCVPITAHWDGDTLLFTSVASSTASTLTVDLGDDAVESGYGIWPYMVFNRDLSGAQGGLEGETGTTNGVNGTEGILGGETSSTAGTEGGEFMQDPFRGAEGGGGSLGPPLLTCAGVGMGARSDQVNVAGEAIQGTRDYDGFTETWTSPDAYGGDPSDPISQQKYVWNNNNPIEYSDPSGYAPIEEDEEELGSDLPRTESPSYAFAETEAVEQQLTSQHVSSAQLDKIINNENAPDNIRSAALAARENRFSSKQGSTETGTPGGRFSRRFNRENVRGKKCAYCGAPAEHGEHIIPRSRDGDNSPENHNPACAACNLSKGAQTPFEWIQSWFRRFLIILVAPCLSGA